MSELARPLAGPAVDAGTLAARRGSLLDLHLTLTWENAVYLTLLAVAFGMRFWDLDSRALHHDESLHAYYSYQILQGAGYDHTPLVHGPLQFFGMALTFFLAGGAGDYTARVLPALFGVALVALPWLFRSYLGRGGALATAALIAFSPTLLYYSRFAREDVYAAVFTLGLVICLWRYLEEQRLKWLCGFAGMLALSFATKENTFVTVAILLLFLDLRVASELARAQGARGGRRAIYFIAFVAIGWVIAAVRPFAPGMARRLRFEGPSPAADALLVLGTLAGPQFAAGVELPFGAAGFEINTGAEERLVGIPTVMGLLAASAAVGLRWNGRGWLIAAAFFYVPYTLLFTSFFTNPEGFAGGIWESLDYWMSQHGVRRADQPDFYYLMFMPGYEFLSLIFAGPALLYYSLRGGVGSWVLTGVTVTALLAYFGADSFGGGSPVEALSVAGLPVAAVALFGAVRGTAFERFLVFWTAASLVAYSSFGEKMPWLNMHIALPTAILAGYAAGRVLSLLRPAADRDWQPAFRTAVRPVAAGVLIAVAAAALALAPGDSPWQAIQYAVVALALAGVLLAAPGLSRRAALPFLVLIAAAPLAFFSVRLAVLATYEHGNVPREFLFYTQTSPDVPDVRDRIERLAVSSGQGLGLRIQIDNSHTWPWGWYLRDYDNATYETMDGLFSPDPGAVLLVASANDVLTAGYRDAYQPATSYTVRWWFPEDEYRGAGRTANVADGFWDFARGLGEGVTWERWWSYFVHRNVTPIRSNGVLYVPREYAALEGNALAPGPAPTGQPTTAPTADLEGRIIIGTAGSGAGQMLNPAGAAVAADGHVFVIEMGNSRGQLFDPGGGLAGTLGAPGGDAGQFNQPSDVAIDKDGNIYVADTWNHRIQKFAPDFTFITSWGKPTRDLINPEPDELWGPRGIAVDADGNVWVTDTGTHRVRKFSGNGEPLASFGRRGAESGEFNEPVGIAVGADGAIYVADAGNARIQKFDKELKLAAVWPVESWADRSPLNKPQLELLPDGRLMATDGPHGRIMLIDREGLVVAQLDTVAEVPLFFPAGIAFDAERGYVYVTDGLAGHVRRFPFTDFALR